MCSIGRIAAVNSTSDDRLMYRVDRIDRDIRRTKSEDLSARMATWGNRGCRGRRRLRGGPRTARTPVASSVSSRVLLRDIRKRTCSPARSYVSVTSHFASIVARTPTKGLLRINLFDPSQRSLIRSNRSLITLTYSRYYSVQFALKRFSFVPRKRSKYRIANCIVCHDYS